MFIVSSDLYSSLSQILTNPQVLMGISLGFGLGIFFKGNIFGEYEDSNTISDDEWGKVSPQCYRLVLIILFLGNFWE